MEFLSYGMPIVALVVGYLVSELSHRRTEATLLNRIMAKNYQEFEYYEKKYDKDLKELDHLRDESRDERKNEAMEEPVFSEMGNTNLSGFEEDWEEEEVDKVALKKQEGK